MALEKEIMDKKGVITNYHRIYRYDLDSDSRKVKLHIKNYTNGNFREEEKQQLIDATNLEEKYKQLDELIVLNEQDKEETGAEEGKYHEEIVKLSDSINDLSSRLDKIEEKFVSITGINLGYDVSEEYTLGRLYELIKVMDLFEGSEDV